MGTGTLTDRASGQTILEGFFNDIHSAIKTDFVGRNSSGVPAASQNLGTAAFPWGSIRGDGLIINGSSIDLSAVASPANRVVSGASRSTSNQPAYIDPAGVAGGAQFTVLGATTNLALEIQAVAVSITTDIVKSSLALAPSSNNTCLVNDTAIADQAASRLAGESWNPFSQFKDLTIDAIGTGITALDQTVQAFKINNGVTDEYFLAFVDTTNNKLTKCFRGFFMDDTLAPINRLAIANNDTITLMKLHWIFADSDAVTIDTTVTPPTYSFTAPSSPATGDYWFDLGTLVWKRFDGASFVIVTRTLIGYAVVDDTDCVAARSIDFDVRYRDELSMPLEIQSVEIIRGRELYSKVNVAGNEIFFGNDFISWNITTDLAVAADMYDATEQSTRIYYYYLTDEGETIISDIEPYRRSDFFSMYHPHNPWRCVGYAFNDSSGDLAFVTGFADETKFNGIRVATGNGHGSSNTAIRRFSTTIEQFGMDVEFVQSSTQGDSFLIRRDGYYAITYTDARTDGASEHGVTLNSVELSIGIAVLSTDSTRLVESGSSSNISGNAAYTGFFKAGDIIRPHTDTFVQAVDPSFVHMSVFRTPTEAQR